MNAPRADVLTVVQLLLAKYHRDVVVPQLATYADRIRELEAQVTQQARQLERGHCGVYQPGALYEKGDEVLVNGSTFRARIDDPSGPPPGEGWQMIAQGRKYNSRGQGLRAA
jgi:hypothetical protein